MNCMKCRMVLTDDEAALHKKLFGKLSTEFFCLECMAEYFEVPRKLLEDKIVQFRGLGCSLFK